MRKLFILPMVLAVFFADFGAFGATARGGRGNASAGANNAASGAAPVAARAAVRGAKPASTSAAQPAKQNSPMAARAATRNAPKTTATASAGGAVAARAGAKQKVINMGTKISSATTNTAVDQECQNAFFGCMDSFCMLDNVSGGRCQCSDKNAEYEAVLAAIIEMDEQSQVLQTEGVSLLKMGKSADEVYAMAEKAAKKVGGDDKSKKDTKQETKKSATLDLSAWNNKLFSDADEEEEEEVDLGIDLKDKKGDELQTAVAKTCARQVPDKCKSSVNLLRPMYTQKIASDCAAFGNGLKQQQMESNQKLLAAKQALRDTALEKYNEANKYDLGGCVREYTTCMQQEDVCGDGFLGCVTFAAVDNMQSNSSGKVAKQTTVKGTYSSFTLAASTMEQLMSKRVMCDSVLEQCVNVQSRVWDSFLKNAAPLIKVAESNAESDLRMNCIDTVSKCFQKACKEQMDPNDPDGSYDGCITNPDMYKSLCKVQLEPCLLATGGTYDNPNESSLWGSLKARLESMKVDACTQEVKDCLLSEDRCGKDYAGCIGLSTYQIGMLCPFQKLTACMTANKNDESVVREYVAKVAEGLALNIDNSMLTQCQTALKQAMIKYCGDEESCPMAKVDESLFKGMLHVDLCNSETETCNSDPYSFGKDELISGQVQAMLVGKVDVTALTYNNDVGGDMASLAKNLLKVGKNSPNFFVIGTDRKDKVDGVETFGYNASALDRAQQALIGSFNNMVRAIESDPKVGYCINGRNFQGFDANNKSNQAWLKKFNGGEGYTKASAADAKGRFPNLTDTVKNAIGQQLVDKLSEAYQTAQLETFDEQFTAMNQKLNERISEIISVSQEEQHQYNQVQCDKLRQLWSTDPEPHFGTGCTSSGRKSKTDATYAEYSKEDAMCTVTKYEWKCAHSVAGCCWSWNKGLENASVAAQKKVPMPTVNRSSMIDGSYSDSVEGLMANKAKIDKDVAAQKSKNSVGGKIKDAVLGVVTGGTYTATKAAADVAKATGKLVTGDTSGVDTILTGGMM